MMRMSKRGTLPVAKLKVPVDKKLFQFIEH